MKNSSWKTNREKFEEKTRIWKKKPNQVGGTAKNTSNKQKKQSQIAMRNLHYFGKPL